MQTHDNTRLGFWSARYSITRINNAQFHNHKAWFTPTIPCHISYSPPRHGMLPNFIARVTFTDGQNLAEFSQAETTRCQTIYSCCEKQEVCCPPYCLLPAGSFFQRSRYWRLCAKLPYSHTDSFNLSREVMILCVFIHLFHEPLIFYWSLHLQFVWAGGSIKMLSCAGLSPQLLGISVLPVWCGICELHTWMWT